MKHCCNEMSELLDERVVALGYSAKFRSYYIDLRNEAATQDIYYCPWCGKKLSTSLYDQFDDELSKFLNIDIDDIWLDTYRNKNLPKEFRTDEWWKKRGL